jgi:uncharacterized phage-like protein YoqJ
MKKICAIVGHKADDIPLVKKSLQQQSKLKEFVAFELEELIKQGVIYYLCGMDDGTDLLCCEVLLSLKSKYPDISLECVIPYMNQPKFWLVEDRERYYSILEKCDKKKIIEQEYTNNSYLKRNIYLAAEADIILAILKLGNLSRAESTLRYAGPAGKSLILIHPVTLFCKKYDQFNFKK